MADTKETLDPLTILDLLAENATGLGTESIVKRITEGDATDALVESTDETLAELDEHGLIKGHDNNQHYLTDDGLATLDDGEVDLSEEPESDLEALAQEVPDDLNKEEIVNYTGRNGVTYKHKPGARRVEKEKRDEEMTVDYYFPPQDDVRTLKRYLTDGEACPMKRRIISEDAIADGFADDPDEFRKRAIRLVCPGCGRAVGADINNEGVVRIATHVLPENGTTTPRGEHFVFTGDEEETPLGEGWEKRNPSDDEDDE